MTKEERELQLAYSKKEKNEKLLSNLEKLREEGSVTDEQYESMKSNYTGVINEATSAIEQIKSGISRDIESEEKTLETYKQELKNLEARFKVGELSADEYQKSEQRTRSKIEREQAKVSELKRLLDSKSSADVGGYAEAGERKGAKAVSAGKGLPALEDIIANKKILFGIIGIVAVVAIIAGIALVGFGGTSAKGVMKQLPGSNYFNYINFKSIEESEDLANIGEYYRDRLGYDEKYGITKSDYLGMADNISLIGGVLDLESIRYHLDDRGFTKGKYEEIELWKKALKEGEKPYGWEEMPSWLKEMYEWGRYTESVALLGDKVVVGNENDVKDAIRVIKGEKQSLYETNSKMTRIVDKLSSGFLVMITSMPMYMEYKDLEAMGTSIQETSEGRLKIHYMFEFDDKYSAGNAKDDVRSDLEEGEYLHNIDVTTQGRYVIATATFEVEDWRKIVWW